MMLSEGNHMMIDLETLATDPNCVVLSFGAVLFNNGKIFGDFYAVFNYQEQIDLGRSVSADTLKWWMSQSEKAKADAFLVRSGTNLTEFFEASLKYFLEGVDTRSLQVWGNGADFDLAIMSSLHNTYLTQRLKVTLGTDKDIVLTLPWPYTNHRCYKTYRKISGCDKYHKREGTHHNALDDAKYQANCLIKYWNAEGKDDQLSFPNT